MKQAVNFRLSPQTIAVLAALKKTLHVSKTDIVEEALHYYAEKKAPQKNSLLEFVGMLSEGEAKKMLSYIRASRKNKKDDISL